MLKVLVFLFAMKLTGVFFFRFVFFLIWWMQGVEQEADFGQGLQACLQRKVAIVFMPQHYPLYLDV